jgi:hypothetical protein
MFAYYPDLFLCTCTQDIGSAWKLNSINQSISNSSDKAASQTCDKAAGSPQPRWSPSPHNRLLGNIVHLPIRDRQKSSDYSMSGCRASIHTSKNTVTVAIGSVEDSISQICDGRRGQDTPSLVKSDASNFSPTMQRALRFLRLQPANTGSQQRYLDDDFPMLKQLNLADDPSMVNSAVTTELQTQHSRHSKSALSEELRSILLESFSNDRGHPMVPTNLDGEFVVMKDTLNPSGGVKVSNDVTVSDSKFRVLLKGQHVKHAPFRLALVASRSFMTTSRSHG